MASLLTSGSWSPWPAPSATARWCSTGSVVRAPRWTTRHRSGRTLVGHCDFITDLGHRLPEGTRRELGYPGGGPEWMVTELGVFDYDAEGHARLRQIFPDVTVDEIEASTGFDLR